MDRAPILCFGEILWDCLPRGLFLGGAPYNVACHLARLGRPGLLLSAVGEDFLGAEALRRARGEGVDVRGLAQLSAYPTGVAQVEVAADGRAAYVFPAPAAWDFISVGPAECAQVESVAAVVFGSLAARAASNRLALERLLAVPGPLRIMDVNLRPPHDDRETVLALAQRADVVKLNAEELAVLAGRSFQALDDPRPLLQQLRLATGVARWCVTLGAEGAIWWDGASLIRVAAPRVAVCDTVGAGDAFLAALVDGLTSPSHESAKLYPASAMPALLERACRLGALVASRDGACPAYRPEEIA